MMLGSNISHKRKALKLSQEYVAEQLGVSRQAVSKWETNLSEPSTDNLIKLADLFDCDIKELISPEKYLVEQKNIANQLEYSKNDSRMHLFAFFGRLITLLSFLGVIGAYSDDVDFSLNWFYYTLFTVGVVLIFIASRDYYKRLGSKKIILFDIFFFFSFLLYNVMPFSRSINTLVVMIYGTGIVGVINIKYFIPVWKK